MASPLASRLETYTELAQDDRHALDRLSRSLVHQISPRRDIVREGEDPRVVRLILDGWACRYKGMADGRRQVVGYFIPGDFCDLNIYLLRRMDHSIGTITSVRLAEISREQMEAATADRPGIVQAFRWHELLSASIQREWLLSVGQRSSLERVAHLMTEMFFRSRSAGLAEGDSCPFPLNPYDIAEATGLTPVHVNRTIQEMRRGRLIEVDGGRLFIPELERLIEAAQFNPSYLHLDREGRNPDSDD